MRAHFIMFILICLCPQLAFAQRESSKLNDHVWTKWKVGAYAKFRVVVEAKGQPTQRGETKFTLQKVEQGKYVLEESKSLGSVEKTKKSEKRLSDDSVRFDSKAEKVGTEVLSVEGKKYECDIWRQTKVPREGWRQDKRTWLAKNGELEVALRTTTVIRQGDEIIFQTEMRLVATDEEIEVGENILHCFKMEGEDKNENGEVVSTAEMWLSLEIPGGKVRVIQKNSLNGLARKLTYELVEFKGEKR